MEDIEKVVRDLQDAVRTGEWKEELWECVKLFQGVPFRTSGRGSSGSGGVDFTYQMKLSNRTGKLTDEIYVSRKERSKTITRSTVELAMVNALAVQAEEGCVAGPKKLKVFGASYLYALFLRWGVVAGSPAAGKGRAAE